MSGKQFQIGVASQNPVKIQAALAGFQAMFPDRMFGAEGRHIPSGVDDQPKSDAETLQGATNRARGLRKVLPGAEYAVGIEGGIDLVDGQMFASAWAVILGVDQMGQARSGTFVLPPRVQELVEQGHELGTANDMVFGKSNSKQAGGAIGSLSHGVVSRQQLYEHAMVLALIPFKRPELFPY